jgi:hypothetical protein
MSIDEWDYIIQHPQFHDHAAGGEGALALVAQHEGAHRAYKANQIIEDSLLQFQQYLHSPPSATPPKSSSCTALQKQTGVGSKDAPTAAMGERFEININYGRRREGWTARLPPKVKPSIEPMPHEPTSPRSSSTPRRPAAEFMKSAAFFRLVAGPVGSGKTTPAFLSCCGGRWSRPRRQTACATRASPSSGRR